MKKALIAAILALLLVPSTATAQIDLLSGGVFVRGSIQFEREKTSKTDALQQQTDSLLFFVNIGSVSGSSALIRLMAKYAANKAYVSAAMYTRLVSGGTATIRLADIAPPCREQPVCAAESYEGVVQCRSNLSSRDAMEARYDLRCGNIDDNRRAKTDAGEWIFEVDIFVNAPNQSPADRFLLDHDWVALKDAKPERDPFVYVRVEK